jgi:hypothetical protein
MSVLLGVNVNGGPTVAVLACVAVDGTMLGVIVVQAVKKITTEAQRTQRNKPGFLDKTGLFFPREGRGEAFGE